MMDTERSRETRPDPNDQPEDIGVNGQALLRRMCIVENGKGVLQAVGWDASRAGNGLSEPEQMEMHNHTGVGRDPGCPERQRGKQKEARTSPAEARVCGHDSMRNTWLQMGMRARVWLHGGDQFPNSSKGERHGNKPWEPCSHPVSTSHLWAQGHLCLSQTRNSSKEWLMQLCCVELLI